MALETLRLIQFQGIRESNLWKMGELHEIWAQNLSRHGHVCETAWFYGEVAGSIPVKKWCHRISLPYFAGSLTTSVNKKHHIRLGGLDALGGIDALPAVGLQRMVLKLWTNPQEGNAVLQPTRNRFGIFCQPWLFKKYL
jgi:hypothetical protein